MPSLFLLIPDPALREAVAEQIQAEKLAAPIILEKPNDFAPRDEDNGDIVIIDEPAAREETQKILRYFQGSAERPVTLLLSKAEDFEDATETFIKPFRLGHLMARLRYYIETAPKLRDKVVFFGPFRLEPQKRRIFRADSDEPIRLTEKETALLVFLAQSDLPASRQDILAAVWGYDERIDTHTLETHIYQLRRKLDLSGENWLVFESGAYSLAGKKE